MVIRYYCKCSTCGQLHTLRISVGHEPRQEHTLRCKGCREEMVVAMQLFPETASVKVECVSNCKPSQEEGLIVNLHPEFTIPADQLHQDHAFPWMEHTQRIVIEQHKLLGGLPDLGNYEEMRKFALDIQSTSEGWTKIKKAWSLIQNGRNDLAKVFLESYQDYGFDSPHELNYVLFDFGKKLLGPQKASILQDANTLCGSIAKQFNAEFAEFRQYYLCELHGEHLKRYFDVFSEYFRDFSEFKQTLLFSQYSLPLPDNAQASSNSFKRTRMFYGNAFEVMTSNFTLLACLNNVAHGRQYGQFETMDIAKYLTTNKANRSNAFKDAPTLYAFAERLDSTLRNASHHGAMSIDQTGHVITYRSGGTGAQHRMAYATYLYECNELFLRVVALLMLELAIAF